MKKINKLFVLLTLVALLVSGFSASPKTVQAQTPPEKLAVFESFGMID